MPRSHLRDRCVWMLLSVWHWFDFFSILKNNFIFRPWLMKHFNFPKFCPIFENWLHSQNKMFFFQDGDLRSKILLSRTHHLWNSTIKTKLFTVSCYGYEQWPPLSSLALPPLPVCREPPWAAYRHLRRRHRSCLYTLSLQRRRRAYSGGGSYGTSAARRLPRMARREAPARLAG
jgi:hypothetical protein